MTTIEKIKMDGIAVVEKMMRGETLTSDDKVLLKAYKTLTGGKAFNQGLRKDSKNTQKA